MIQRKLLIDADLLCHQQTAAVEFPANWGGGLWTLHADAGEAIGRIACQVERLVEETEADGVVLAWNDLQGSNFRKDLDSTYKGNRAGTRKPVAFPEVREWMMDQWPSYDRPGLEGDDILGILATHPKLEKAKEKVIFSGDKDMLTIPGLHYIDGEIVEVTEEAADDAFFFQTLTGDQTDGYPGCPGIGPKRARAILDEESSWEQVVAAYAAKNLSEAVALHQARLARILRASDYDFKTKKPILWEPPE